jgi:hypothetical protein
MDGNNTQIRIVVKKENGVVECLARVDDVRAQVMLSLSTDFEDFSVFKPAPLHGRSANTMFDQLIAWGSALRVMRRK